MKKTDLVMIVVIASIGMVIAFFVAKTIFGDVYNGSAKVKTVDPISSSVEEPSADIFNKNAINPAVQVNISETK